MSDRGDGADELLAARRRKLESLREAGIDPFPHEFDGVEPIAAVRAAYEGLSPGDETESRHRVAGRLAARRGQGKMAFLDLVDRSGRIQLQARVDELGPEGMDRLLGLDLGDLVGIDGLAFMSRRGELTLRVVDFTLLAKSLRPPPEKHHGLTDVETRFRRRELDLIGNQEARELFITRARVISAVRRFLVSERRSTTRRTMRRSQALQAKLAACGVHGGISAMPTFFLRTVVVAAAMSASPVWSSLFNLASPLPYSANASFGSIRNAVL